MELWPEDSASIIIILIMTALYQSYTTMMPQLSETDQFRPPTVTSNKAKLISHVSAAQFSRVAELISTQPTIHRNSVLFIVFVCSLKKLGAQLQPRPK